MVVVVVCIFAVLVLLSSLDCRKLSVVDMQVCPICAVRVGVDMVAHITLQHGNIFKISFLSVPPGLFGEL